MAKKSLTDYPEAVNRITEKIISEYGHKIKTAEDFSKVFKEYMHFEDKKISNAMHEQYMIRTGQAKSEGISWDEELLEKQVRKGFNYKGLSKGTKVIARKEKIVIRGKPTIKYRDAKGRFVKVVNE